jgi:Carboxypeptidase regulatory-like domain
MVFTRYRGLFQLLAAIALTLISVSAIAQIAPGKITGTVKDSQGAVVVGATVKLTNPSTGINRSAETDANGEFNFPELALGTYQLTVDKSGFETTVLSDIATAVGQVNTLTPILTVGSASTQIKVTADPLLLQTETNSAGGQLSEKQITSLPIGNSDYTRLALTLPGATQNSNFAFAQYTINGSRSRSNGFNIDGISNTDPSTYLPSLNEGGNSATAATRLPLDAIAEVSVVSAAPADIGQNSGSVMNAIVKSGTNQLHGAVYEYHRDAALDAANFFENLGGISKAPFVWNEYGGSVGGPITIPHVYSGRNRTFFFFAYDGSQLRLGTTLNGSAPTSLDVQQATAALATLGLQPNQLGLNVLNLYTSLGLQGPFVVDNRGRQSPSSYIGKIDQNFSSADLLSARYVYAKGEDEFPGGSSGPQGGSQLSPWFGVTPTAVENLGISETHIFSPNAINSLRIGWNRFDQFQKGRDADVNPDTIGLNTGVGPESYGIPEFDIGGSGPGRYSNLGLQYGAGGRVATSFQVADDFSLTHGRHAMKFGFNWLHDYSNYTIVGSRGLFTFDGSQLGTQLVASLSQPGPGSIQFANPQGAAGIIDLLGGQPSPGNTEINRVGSDRANIYQNLTSGYAMDTYKATENLTVIAGLRYDFMGTVGESRGRFSAFDQNLGLVPASELPGGKIYDAPPRNFGPRFAATYLLPKQLLKNRSTILRTGYGIYYDTLPLTTYEEGLPQNPIGPTGGYSIVPSAPIPFGVGVAIFGTGAPQPPFNVGSVDHNLKTPNTQIWSLNVQQELSPRFVLQLGYIGNKSSRQTQLLDINQPTPAPPSPDTSQSRRPYNAAYPTLRQINTISTVGWANYNSFQLVLKSNNFYGLTTQTAFTWSHNLDTASEVDDFSGTSGYVPQDSRNLAGSYGNSEFDQRRSLIITWVYEIPAVGKGSKMSYAGRDWQFAGTTTFRDGLAAPLLSADGGSGTDNFHERPDRVGPIHYQLKDLSQPYVEVGAFVPEAPGTFGNAARDPIVAPGLDAWDMSIQRTFAIHERLAFQLRCAFFNAFNHPNFAEPSPDLSTHISATADDGSFDSHFGVGGPRNIQFSGKLTF